MRVTHAVWENENLGVNAWELAADTGDTMADIEAGENEAVRGGAGYIAVKTPVNCPRLLFGLAQSGYTFVETVFRVMVKRKEYRAPESVTRFDRGLAVSRLTDEASLERVCASIRAGVFDTDRISVDPYFTKEQAGNRYANWTRQMAHEGGYLYEVSLTGRPMGYFIIKRVDDSTVDPVLMGLYDSARDRGMGALLHKKTLDTCFEHECTRLTSTVVSNNMNVLRVYLNAGASIYDTLYTYVKHI